MDLNDAYHKIATLRGETLAMHAMISALIQSLPAEQADAVARCFESLLEQGRVALLNSARADEVVSEGFERVALDLLSTVRRQQTGLG